MRIAYVLAALMLGAGPSAAATVSWVDWTSVATDNRSAQGTVEVGGETVTVTVTTTGNGFDFVQTSGGTNYWLPESTYTNAGPNGNSNGPPCCDIIALGFEGTRTVTFSKMIERLYLAYVSWNNNSGIFSQPMEKPSEGPGFGGTGVLTVAPDGLSFTSSGEAHGTLFTPGALDTFSFTTLREFWHGFTIGVRGLEDGGEPPPAPLPLPAGGLLLVTALGGLAALRRRA